MLLIFSLKCCCNAGVPVPNKSKCFKNEVAGYFID